VSATELYEQVKDLPLADRIELAQLLWADIAEENAIELTSGQIAELDHRAQLALAQPERGRSLDDVIADIESKFRAAR
jgi:putative addiction module component (TIGR02574 family)